MIDLPSTFQVQIRTPEDRLSDLRIADSAIKIQVATMTKTQCIQVPNNALQIEFIEDSVNVRREAHSKTCGAELGEDDLSISLSHLISLHAENTYLLVSLAKKYV